MTPLGALIAVAAFVAVLSVLSVWAGRRFAAHERLPTQWGLDGRPVWYAPRLVALGFAPALAVITLTAAALLILVPDQADPSGAAPLALVVVMGVVWIAAHTLHLWLLHRWDRTAAR